MTLPGRSVFLVTIASFLFLLAAGAFPWLVPIVFLVNVMTLVACWLEGRRLKNNPFVVERYRWLRGHLNREQRFVYLLENRGTMPVICRVKQIWPASFESTEKDAELLLAAGEAVEIALLATPRARGKIYVPPTQVELRTPQGWSVLRWRQNHGESIPIYPDLEKLVEYDQLKHARALVQLGIHRQRTVGGGREFDQLRNYLPDDDFRQIDWKATARRQKLTTVVHRIERSQSVLLCLDCGRMMGNPAGTGTYLDKAVDACSLLAHVANEQGDQVGLLLFRDRVEKYLPPKHGRSQVLRVIDQLVDLEVEGVFPSYADWAKAIEIYHRKRSLVILFTDLGDVQLSADLAAVMPIVTKRHVVVVLGISDPTLDRIANGPSETKSDLYRVLAARTLADERAARKRQLIQAGVHVFDVEHASLVVHAVNAYLSIKSRQIV